MLVADEAVIISQLSNNYIAFAGTCEVILKWQFERELFCRPKALNQLRSAKEFERNINLAEKYRCHMGDLFGARANALTNFIHIASRGINKIEINIRARYRKSFVCFK